MDSTHTHDSPLTVAAPSRLALVRGAHYLMRSCQARQQPSTAGLRANFVKSTSK